MATATRSDTGGREQQSSHFAVSSRRLVAEGKDLFVKEFTLLENECVPWHRHTNVFDIFYCLEGRLEIGRIEIASGQRQSTLELAVGESARVDTDVAHRPFNPGPGPCRFLLVQGVGAYDFLPFQAAR